MSAILPPLPAAMRHASGSELPDRCPWCWAPQDEGARGVSWGCYLCTGFQGTCYHQLEDVNWHFSSHCSDRCPNVPADVAAVVRDIAAANGVELLDLLMGRECRTCRKAGKSFRVYQRWECEECGGTGRIEDPRVAPLLAAARLDGAART